MSHRLQSTARTRSLILTLVMVSLVQVSVMQSAQTSNQLQASIFDSIHDFIFGSSSSAPKKPVIKHPAAPAAASSSSITSVEPAIVSAPVVREEVIDQTVGFHFRRTLRTGMKGNDVMNLQLILNNDPATQMATTGDDSPSHETGIYDYKTRIGLIAFQKLNLTTPAQLIRLRREQGFAGLTTRVALEAFAKTLIAAGKVSEAGATFHGAADDSSTDVTQSYSSSSSRLVSRAELERLRQERLARELGQPVVPYNPSSSESSSSVAQSQTSSSTQTTSTASTASTATSSVRSAASSVPSSVTSTASSAVSSTASITSSAASSMASAVPGQTCASISQYGITWTFDKTYPCGTFANGDWWVVGPVSITRMTPDFDGQHHGFEVNPKNITTQGYDVRVAGFTAGSVPSLPYLAQPNQSIVKAISLAPLTDGGCRPCLDTAAVLTVLGSVPDGNGADYFRPPYFSSAKPLYKVSDLQLNKLPSYAPVAGAPTLQKVTDLFKRVQLDHLTNWVGRSMHPKQNMPDYGSSIAINTAEGALRLMLSDSTQAKLPAVISYVQMGIDWYHIGAAGGKWPANGGHDAGRKLPIAFAAALFDNAAMKQFLATVPLSTFQEDDSFFDSPAANNGRGFTLYGQPSTSERTYWTNMILDTDSRTQKDPYGYIDGGHIPAGSYQVCCVSMPAKQITVALGLMPELRTIWHNDSIIKYAERWVTFGAWTQPDPCAPMETTMANYGITFGPDGHGSCIKDTNPSDGIGRFPQLHGAQKNGGTYGSVFANNMWTANYHLLFPTQLP